MRTAITAALKADPRTGTGVEVTTHGGSFGLDDVAAYNKRAPAIVVALLSAPIDDEQVPTVRANWVILVITNDKAGSKRDASAIALTDAAVRVLTANFFGSGTRSRLQAITPRNMFSPKLDAVGVAMWAITATQRIDLEDDAGAGLDELRTVDATYVAPSPPAEDVITIAQDD